MLDENYPSLLNGKELETNIKDYIICESVEDAQIKINEFIEYLNKVIVLEKEEENYYFESGYIDKNETVPEGFKHLEHYYLNMIAVCYSAYNESEYYKKDSSDKLRLKKLTTTPYIADFTHPYDYNY